MNKDLLIKKLVFYNWIFTQTERSVSIKVGLGLYLDVFFLENGKIKIKEIFKGYNFFSGFIRFSIKGQLLYTSILYFILTVVTGYIMYTTPDLIIYLSLVYSFYSVLSILWFLYYLIRAESTKKQIMEWLDK